MCLNMSYGYQHLHRVLNIGFVCNSVVSNIIGHSCTCTVLLSFQVSTFNICSDHCRDEFDNEKEPDGMVLAGWSGPADKQITSNGDKRSIPSSSSADDFDGTADDASGRPGMKRKLDEILESNENFDTAQNPTEAGSSSAQVVEDDDDDCLMLDEAPKLGKRKRWQ